jgi:hypothetical protein
MAVLTLLQVVQDIQSSMDAEESNDLNETEEALQIATVVRSVFDEFKTLGDWSSLKKVRQLESVGDTNKPTLLKIPEVIDSVENLRYESTKLGETNRVFKEVRYLETEDFLAKIYSRRTDSDNTIVFDTDEGIPITILTNIAPTYWTSFDDNIVVCDSHDSEVDATLIQAKTIIEAKESPLFSFSNDFKFDPMPSKMFPTFLARCRVKAHEYFLDQVPQTDLQEATRGLARLRFDESRIGEERRRRKLYGRRGY